MSTSCYEVCEHRKECRALEVIRQDWSSEVVAHFLEDELVRVALSCLGPCVPRNERCVPRKRCVTVFAVLRVFAVFRSVWKIWKILSPWKGDDSKERSVGREVKGKGRRRRSAAWCPFFSSEEPGFQAVIVLTEQRVPLRN